MGPKYDGKGVSKKHTPAPGVLHDAKLSSLGEAHAQIDNPYDDNEHANWGGIESQDAD